MPKIRFTRSTTPNEAGESCPKLGDELAVDQASADRWIRRGAAVLVEDQPAPKTTPKPKTKEAK